MLRLWEKTNQDTGINYHVIPLKTTETESELWQYCPEIAALTMAPPL